MANKTEERTEKFFQQMKGKEKKTEETSEEKEKDSPDDWEKRTEEMKPRQRSFLLLPEDWEKIDKAFPKFMQETGIQKKWKFYRATIRAGIKNWKDIIEFAKK